MSQENVEVVRRYFEEAPEDPGQDAAWADRFWDPDADYYPARKFPEARPCHGRKEIVRFLTEYLAAWDDYRYVVKDARAIGDDRVLVQDACRPRDARAARRWKATSTTAAGCGMDD